MKELPGDVFVHGQIDIVTLKSLAEQGVMTFINNRPDNEAAFQPSSASLADAAKALGVDYVHIPMAGNVSPEIIEASLEAFENLPRPIVAFCASGTRSSALWALTHVKAHGVDEILKILADAGYSLGQIRPLLEQMHARDIGRA